MTEDEGAYCPDCGEAITPPAIDCESCGWCHDWQPKESPVDKSDWTNWDGDQEHPARGRWQHGGL